MYLLYRLENWIEVLFSKNIEHRKFIKVTIMFNRLLDSARTEARNEVATPIQSSPKKTHFHELSNGELCDLFSEFLFDIFDANCMDEFKQIEALEIQQCVLFSVWKTGDEFTLEQGRAHRSFCDLFEILCSQFLVQHQVTQEQLFEAAQSAMKEEQNVEKEKNERLEKGTQRQTWEQSAQDQANEIWDVVRSVQSIEVWAQQMKENFDRHYSDYSPRK